MSKKDYVLLEKYKALGKPEELQKIRNGKWKLVRSFYDADTCICTTCGKRLTTKHGKRERYCPGCGAQMEVEV